MNNRKRHYGKCVRLPRCVNMADAFGDDLFSVFDDEQTASSKAKPAPPAGYVQLVSLFSYDVYRLTVLYSVFEVNVKVSVSCFSHGSHLAVANVSCNASYNGMQHGFPR